MPLAFEDVREQWDVIKPGLIEVNKDRQPDWRLEDVYASLVNGNSHLLMDRARTQTGFMVVESVPIPFRNAQKLLIWIAYDPEPESLATYASEIEKLARDTGHKQIEFLTPHNGVKELGIRFGYELKWSVLNKAL
mgnify:FL=1